jgi:DNA-binding transcriptional LysR family regulator
MSQPTLSRSISRLEIEYKVKLFDRSGRRMRINAAGRMLLARVERVLAELEDARRELSEVKARDRQLVSIGFLATFGANLIPDLIRRFKAVEPGTEFRLLQGPYPTLHDRLVAGEIDLCLASPRFTDSNLDWEALFDEELVVIVPSSHRLASRAQIDLKELAKEPFVALKHGYGLRHYFDELTRKAGFEPKVAFEGEEVATLQGLVGAGFGVAMVPRDRGTSDLVARISVRDPACWRTIGLSWRRGRYLPERTLRFRDLVLTTLGRRPPRALGGGI